jgi:hypothetical protein
MSKRGHWSRLVAVLDFTAKLDSRFFVGVSAMPLSRKQALTPIPCFVPVAVSDVRRAACEQRQDKPLCAAGRERCRLSKL